MSRRRIEEIPLSETPLFYNESITTFWIGPQRLPYRRHAAVTSAEEYVTLSSSRMRETEEQHEGFHQTKPPIFALRAELLFMPDAYQRDLSRMRRRRGKSILFSGTVQPRARFCGILFFMPGLSLQPIGEYRRL